MMTIENETRNQRLSATCVHTMNDVVRIVDDMERIMAEMRRTLDIIKTITEAEEHRNNVIDAEWLAA